MQILLITFFSLLGSIGAIIVAATCLFFERKFQTILIPCLISYATGTLLAGALFGLLPNALENTSVFPIMYTVLMGILLFFLLEKMLIWRHCHNKDCDVHSNMGNMILVGDAFHNFTDGIVIAASFIVDMKVGIIAALSVIAHEIPQEVGDFGILLHSGYTKKRAFVLNTLSGLFTLPGAIITYYTLDIIHEAVPYVMAFSAASFLYIALADLAPELHHTLDSRGSIRQILLMLAGIGTIILILNLHI